MTARCMIGLALACLAPLTSSLGHDVDWFTIPDPIQECLDRENLATTYTISGRLNPFYLRGDFDGDKKPDYTVFVRRNEGEQEGIIICQSSTSEVAVIAAGTSFRLQGDIQTRDLRHFNFWMVSSHEEIKYLTRRGEGICLGQAESGSGVIYRKDGKYVWEQLAI